MLGYTCSRQTSASSVLAERGLRPLGKERPVGDADHRQVEQGPEVKSEPIHARALDGAERRASLALDPDVRVASVGDETVTLAPIDDYPPPELETQGLWGLRWADGYGQLGDIVGRDGPGIERSFSILHGDPPDPGAPAEIDARAFPDVLTAGVRARDVFVRGPLGRYPAWFVPGDRKTWVVVFIGSRCRGSTTVGSSPRFETLGIRRSRSRTETTRGCPRIRADSCDTA